MPRVPGLPLIGVALALALAGLALRAERSHRVAAERALRDFAAVAATEVVRRAAFDIGFNGFQTLAAGLRRTGRAGEMSLPPQMNPRARGLVARLFDVKGGQLRQLAGSAPPDWLVDWIREVAAQVPDDPASYYVQHRVVGGRAVALLVTSVDDHGKEVGAVEIDPAGERFFLQRALDRGPLLPEMVGDGKLGNGALAVRIRDAAGAEILRNEGQRWPEFEVIVPFGDYYSRVFEGTVVAVSVDPSAAHRLIPGGLPRSYLPLLALLLAGAAALGVFAARQERRERAFARLREDFAVSVSHELRTPLAQVRLALDTVLLERCRSAAEQREFLERASREVLRLSHLVDNILDFANAERGIYQLDPEPRPLAPLVRSVVEGFAPLAVTRKAKLELQLDPELRSAVDEAGFTRLLLNLLDNAVKYGPQGGEVLVRLEKVEREALLAVEDAGPGIPAGEREKVFAPFHRLERDRRSARTGAGLGLALVREVASRHGGSCRVEEREGGGARFVVALPLAEAAS
jgi:signal transduction histidine kinase